MTLFAWGACAAAGWTAGLFFWKFYRDTRDRLFAMFAAAFWCLTVHWCALAIVNPPVETRHYFFLLRLLAFLLITAAILDKNRSGSRGESNI